MSDEEWQRWMETYAKEGRPLPSVMGRARTDRRRALIGLIGAYAICGFLVLEEIPELRDARTIVAFGSSLFTPLCVLLILVGVHLTTWGILGQSGGTPLDLLADLERRHVRRRRLLRFLPWVTGFAVCGTIAIHVSSMLAAGRFDLLAALGTLAICAATSGSCGSPSRRVGSLIDRELRQSAEARRLLSGEG